jgi:general secretion pathway protein D
MGNNVVGSAGTAPSFNGRPSTANPEGTFPGSVVGGTAIPPSASDQVVTGGLRNNINAPAIGSITGILTDPQFRVVMRALQQRDGVDLLNEASVTTLSGRQTQIQVVDLQTIVSGVSLNQTSGGGGGGFGGATAPGAIGSQINYPLSTIPVGPTLDVVPYVSADGFTIQMTIIPTITEFLGYDDPGEFVPQAQSVSGGSGGAALPITAVLPLPHFRVRQVTTSAIVWDGQTVVLGGLITENVTKYKDQIPVLGDLPLVGRLFRSESSQTQKKNLVVFVTPTIIDPAGNRYHSDDEMPFNPNVIPPQRPIVPPVQ